MVERAGRDLERLVQTLEELLSDCPIKVESPGYIVGKDSRTTREVDVALRANVGSADLLVILECRDRSAIQDVTWIEQLATKRDDVRASTAIAVSSSGFSAGAQSMADAKGIELRTLESVTLNAVSAWFNLTFIVLRVTSADFHHIDFAISTTEPDDVEAELGLTLTALNADDPIFVRTTDGKALSLNDLWREAPLSPRLMSLPVGIPKRGTYHFRAADGFPSYVVTTPIGPIEIHGFDVDLTLTVSMEILPITRHEYRRDGKVLAEIVRAEVDRNGNRMKFNLAVGKTRFVLTAEADDPRSLAGLDATLLIQKDEQTITELQLQRAED